MEAEILPLLLNLAGGRYLFVTRHEKGICRHPFQLCEVLYILLSLSTLFSRIFKFQRRTVTFYKFDHYHPQTE